ncbi:hypothetical protein COOONC_16261 [Cooperia oncophora]
MRLRRNNWQSGWCTINPGVVYVWPLDKPINAENRLTIPRAYRPTSTTSLDGALQGDRMVWELQSGKQTIQFAHFDPLACRGLFTAYRLTSFQQVARLALNFQITFQISDLLSSVQRDQRCKSSISGDPCDTMAVA